MKSKLYRGARLITANARTKTVTKTLSSTGEHDVWSGADATMPQPDDGTLTITSSSVQDAALAADVWTIASAEGTDAAQTIEVAGVTHGAVPLDSDAGWERLAAAVNSGSKTTYGVLIATLPDNGDDVVVSVGATDYTVQRDSEATTDEMAQAVAAAMAADPNYDAAFAGTGSGAVLITAKTPNVAGPAVSVDFPTTGTGSVLALVAHGPASAVMTAAEDEGDLILTADIPGVAYTVTAESDRVTATHTVTGGAGSGLRAVAVEYITDGGEYRRKIVTLTGTTGADVSDDDVAALLDCYAVSAGDTGGAAGTITIADQTPTTIATIAAGASDVARCEARAPSVAGSPGVRNRLQVARIAASVSAAACTLRVRRSGPSGAGILWSATLPAGGVESWDLTDAPLTAAAGDRVWLTAEGNGATVIAAMTWYHEGEAA